jgi:uncharacterized protein (DUF2384 family)
MDHRDEALLRVEAEARKVLGDDAPIWMARPSKLLDGMAPVDLARSPDGARAVLHELRQASKALKASSAARSRRKPHT